MWNKNEVYQCDGNGRIEFPLLNSMNIFFKGHMSYGGQWIPPLPSYSSLVLDIKGKIDFDRLEKAIQRLYNENQALRIVFYRKENEYYFRILKEYKYDLEILKVDTKKSLESALKVVEKIDTYKMPDESIKDVTFKVILIEISNEEHIIALLLDHAVSDGYSMGLLSQMLFEYYKDIESKKFDDKTSFMEYYTDSFLKETDEKIEYWENERKYYRRIIYSKNTKPHEALSEDNYNIIIENRILNHISKANKITSANIVLMAIHLAIYLTYNQETTFVDVVTANRTESRYSKTIASLARILTNRLSIKKEQTLKELLVETSHKLIENMQHQEGTGSSVSDFILTYMSVNAMNSIGNIEGCDCQIIQKSAKMKTLQYSGIVFFAIADKDVTTIKIGCKREEYNNADIIRIHDAIESVINLLSENPDIMVQDLKKIEGN